MKRLVGLSTSSLQKLYGDRRALEIAHEAGADCVDFSVHTNNDYRTEGCVYALGEEGVRRYYEELAEYAKSLGLTIAQTHGRLRGFRLDETENRAVLENARLDCIATRALGAPVCVVHSVATGLVGPQTPPETFRDLNFEWFTSLLQYAKAYDVQIATETFGDSPKYGICDFFGNAEEFFNSYERIRAEEGNEKYFFCCVDTGHSNKAMRFDNPTPGDVIRMLGNRTVVLHLNDNDTLTDQHKIPMTGCIDWNDVFNALDEVGYSGVYNMELNLTHFGEDFAAEEAAFAVKVMRQMLRVRYGEENA